MNPRPTRAATTRTARASDVELLEPRRLLAAVPLGTPLDLGVKVYDYPDFTPMNGTLYFTGADAAGGLELWRSDGTRAGTRRVVDLNPGPASTFFFDTLVQVGNALYFVANNGTGLGLWKTDGTQFGTSLVRHFDSVRALAAVGDMLYFSADDLSGISSELWKSDGTPGGTTLVKDIAPGRYGSALDLITDFHGLAIFSAADGMPDVPGHGLEPWVSDGTADGTFMLKDIYPGERNGFPLYFTEAGGRLYFEAKDPTHGFELWATDGTSAGTKLVADLKPGSADSGIKPSLVIGDTLYSATEEFAPQDLYRTVGTTGQTTLIKRISDMTNGASAFYFLGLGDGTGRFVFPSPNSATGYEPWISDGTAAGTKLIKEIRPGAAGAIDNTERPAAAGGRVFFKATDGTSGYELWATDGTAAGTVRVADINSGSGSSNPAELTGVGDKLFFAADPTGTSNSAAPGTLWVVAPQVEPTPGRISGAVYNDTDDDGTRDATETGLVGFRPYVDLNDNGRRDSGEPSTTTDGSGNYAFDNVAPGEYILRTELPTGWEGLIVPTRGHAVTVGPGQTVTGAQIPAVVRYGDVAFTAFEDLDRDGVRDPGEPALAGLRLYSDPNRNNTLDAGEFSFVTDASGRYTVNDFVVGTYRFGQVVPPGFRPTVPAAGYVDVVVGSGETRSVLVGDARTSTAIGSISGVVFNDFDSDGARDAGEPVLTGRTVYLDTDNDGVPDAGERSVATDDFGGYAFTALAPGTYFVRQVLPAGWRQTAPASGAAGPAAHTVMLTAGQIASGRDFAAAEILPPGAISGTTYFDANANGVRDAGESALSGRTVYIDADLDGILDAGERSTTTDAAGNYSFAGVSAGTYTLRQMLIQTYVQTQPIGNERSGRAVGQVVTVPSGGAVNGVNFGSVPGSMVGRISGFVFDDVDGNGALNAGENTLVPGRVVYLDADNDAVLDPGERSFTTNVDGFWFDGLAPGTYAVRAVVPPGYRQTMPAGGAPYTVTVAAGQRSPGWYIGLAPPRPTTISGVVYNDADADGTRDPDESGITRTAYVDLDNDGRWDAGVEPAASPDATGRYTIFNVMPGTHVVRVSIPVTDFQTDPGRDANDQPLGWTVTVAEDQPVSGIDFGVVSRTQLGIISGFVFDDANGNGTRDAGEEAPPDRVVYLDADDDGTLDAGERRVTQLGANGYQFRDLAPGAYAVRAVVPAGFVQTFPAAGAAQSVTVGAGETVTTKNIGLAQAPRTSVTLSAVADAYVKDGTSADTKYGTAAELQVKKSSAAGLQRESYLRFDLTGAGPVTKATLRLNGALQSASGESIEIGVYPSADITWPENDVSWNTRPAAGAAPLSSQTVTGTTPQWYEWDVTDYLRQQRAAGATAVTLVLKGVTSSSAYVRFASDEAADAATRPQLVVESAAPSDATAPTVTDVFWNSSNWTPAFLAALAASGLGDGGFRLPPPAEPLARTIPWTNPNNIVIRFSEDVRVQADDLRIIGANNPAYTYRAFQYDPQTFTATWTLAIGSGNDRLRLELDGDGPDAVTDLAGNKLNGAGGANDGTDHVRTLNSLPGDVTGDSLVNALDLSFVKQRLNKTPADAAFIFFADVNGDARINALDLSAVKQRLNQRLPELPPPSAPAPVALFSSALIDPHDDLAALLA